MNKLLKELIETFERLSVVYDDLLDTAKTKQQYLITGNIEGLETLLYQEKTRRRSRYSSKIKDRIFWKATVRNAISKRIKLPYIP